MNRGEMQIKRSGQAPRSADAVLGPEQVDGSPTWTPVRIEDIAIEAELSPALAVQNKLEDDSVQALAVRPARTRFDGHRPERFAAGTAVAAATTERIGFVLADPSSRLPALYGEEDHRGAVVEPIQSGRLSRTVKPALARAYELTDSAHVWAARAAAPVTALYASSAYASSGSETAMGGWWGPIALLGAAITVIVATVRRSKKIDRFNQAIADATLSDGNRKQLLRSEKWKELHVVYVEKPQDYGALRKLERRVRREAQSKAYAVIAGSAEKPGSILAASNTDLKSSYEKAHQRDRKVDKEAKSISETEQAALIDAYWQLQPRSNAELMELAAHAQTSTDFDPTVVLWLLSSRGGQESLSFLLRIFQEEEKAHSTIRPEVFKMVGSSIRRTIDKLPETLSEEIVDLIVGLARSDGPFFGAFEIARQLAAPSFDDRVSEMKLPTEELDTAMNELLGIYHEGKDRPAYVEALDRISARQEAVAEQAHAEGDSERGQKLSAIADQLGTDAQRFEHLSSEDSFADLLERRDEQLHEFAALTWVKADPIYELLNLASKSLEKSKERYEEMEDSSDDASLAGVVGAVLGVEGLLDDDVVEEVAGAALLGLALVKNLESSDEGKEALEAFGEAREMLQKAHARVREDRAAEGEQSPLGTGIFDPEHSVLLNPDVPHRVAMGELLKDLDEDADTSDVVEAAGEAIDNIRTAIQQSQADRIENLLQRAHLLNGTDVAPLHKDLALTAK